MGSGAYCLLPACEDSLLLILCWCHGGITACCLFCVDIAVAWYVLCDFKMAPQLLVVWLTVPAAYAFGYLGCV